MPFGSHSRLPATLTTHANTQPFFNSHHPPRLPPKKCGARMALPRVLQHALDGASLGSISAPPQHAHRCPDPVRDRPISPLHMPPAAAIRIHTARARATPGGRPERQVGDRTLSRPRPSLPPGGQCGARNGRMHAVLFWEFLRVPPPMSAGAPLHVCSCQTCASRRER